jgi:hypothetical protein
LNYSRSWDSYFFQRLESFGQFGEILNVTQQDLKSSSVFNRCIDTLTSHWEQLLKYLSEQLAALFWVVLPDKQNLPPEVFCL